MDIMPFFPYPHLSQQPAVIAEVITGIVLGPTVMGRIPNFTNTIFPKANMAIFGTFAEVGLVLFMNLVGLELDFALMAGEWKSTAIISVVGIALPMAVSVGSSYAVWDAVDKFYPSTKNKTFGTYVLFMYVTFPSRHNIHCLHSNRFIRTCQPGHSDPKREFPFFLETSLVGLLR